MAAGSNAIKRANGWRQDPVNNRLDLYYKGTRVGHVNADGWFSGVTLLTGLAPADDAKITFGTDLDWAAVNRSTLLTANTALTGVLVGTPVTPEVAANSLIIGGVTADGDFMLATRTSTHSYAAMWVDASAAITRFYAGSGIEVLKLASAAVTLTGTLAVTSTLSATATTVTSASATALSVGRLGATTPALLVDASTGTSITGFSVKSAGAGGGVALSAIGETNVNMTLDANGSGTITIGSVSTGAITLTRAVTASSTLTATGALTASSTSTFTGLATAVAGIRIGPTQAGVFSLGTPEAVTIASGAATITRPFIDLIGEAATTDTLDSISKAGQTIGEIILITCSGAYTITFDNSATLILGAGTRAMAAGSSMLMVATSASAWREVTFTTAAS